MRLNKLIGLFFFGLLLTNCAGQRTESTTKESANASPQDNTLTIWWSRGYYAQEDEAIEEVIAAWQSQTGKKVNFSLISEDDILKNTTNALKAGNPPDILFAHCTERTLGPRWAWDGQLADVSEVVEPLKDVYSPSAIQSIYLYNIQAQKRSAYAVPINQRSLHIHYWRDLLAEAGLKEEDIPREWDAFWEFWKQAQDNLRARGQKDIYALGFSVSKEGSETSIIFEQVLEAYDIQILDPEGNLLGDPQIRQRLATALDWFANFYKAGYIPPDATNWLASSNNTDFLNQRVLMTVNATLSIPASLREYEEIYRNQIVTIEFPSEPDGESPRYIAHIHQVVIFESSPHKEMAKDFLSFLLQSKNLRPYLEGSLGRYFPVMPKLAAEPFWNDPADPHISVATRQFQPEKTRPTSLSLNPAYASIYSENVWGRAIERILVDGLSPEAAADEALTRIAENFAQWDN